MREIKRLLNDYLNGLLAAEDFVHQFLAIASQFRDEAWDLLSKNPDLDMELEKLFTKHIKGVLSEEEYQIQYQKLISQLKQEIEINIKPYSIEEKIISHLFVEADAYRENPEDREDGFNIGDEELHVEVQKALEALSKII